MENDERNEDVNEYGKKDGNNDYNAASGSLSDGPIIDMVLAPWSCVRVFRDNVDRIYVRGAPYIHHFKDVPYTDVCKFWRFGLVSLSPGGGSQFD